MDAAARPFVFSLPPADAVTLRVEPIVEPLSGMKLLSVSAWWDRPVGQASSLSEF
jgi:hypothetical protein